jgi:prolyl-tRNA editing enzyme YbaK/EbsC (Cys-tRNA(Pro) deacylase)
MLQPAQAPILDRAMSAAPERVRAALAAAGLDPEVRRFAEGTHTAAQAAAVVGVTPAQIVKSLIFVRRTGREPVLVLTSGANRVDEERLAALVGEAVDRADADTVRAATGFAIGGVAPLGHPAPLETLVDADLLRYDVVWAAAGTPRDVFAIAPADLVRATGGRVAAVAEGAQSSS